MRPLSLVAALAVVASTLLGAAVVAGPANANGCITPAAGTSGDPFLIQTIANLECLRDNASDYWHRGYYFKQTADLDLSATTNWTHGIGDDSDTFTGTYDGDGFAISNLTVTDDTQVGLFGVTEGATLTNITLVNLAATGTGTAPSSLYTYVGGLVGQARAGTTIADSVTSGTITSTGFSAGGLVGEAGSGTVIIGSSSSASVAFSGFPGSMAGGLVGNGDPIAGGLTITDSFATGAVSGLGGVGGLVGAVQAPATVNRSYAAGDATAVLGPVGGLLGSVGTDDTTVVAVDQSFAVGDVSTTNGAAGGLVGAGGVAGSVNYSGLTITDSYSTGAVTTGGPSAPAGGLVGDAVTDAGKGLTLTRTYSISPVNPASSASPPPSPLPGGGILAQDDTTTFTSITFSFWNRTDSGAGATSSFGTESTQGAMRSPSLYSAANWSIADSAPSGTTWVSCAAYNSGYPFLQWYAATQAWSCAPPPAPVFPPSAPLGVSGVAGDGSVVVSWSVPASSGSFAVSNYQVMASPSGRSCVVSALSCEISGLTNGSVYEFTVRALNGAGWGPWSVVSGPVVPVAPVVESIVISGSRGVVRGKPGVIVTGTSSVGLGAVVVPWVRFPGQTSFAQGSAQVAVDEAGGFTWERRTGKKITIYMATPDGSLMSNRIIVRP